MVLYHVTTKSAAAIIRRKGFTDSFRLVEWGGRRWREQGVWFSDLPVPDDHQALGFGDSEAVALAVPEDRLFQYEVVGPERDRRRWYLPASVANQYLRLCDGSLAENDLQGSRGQ